MSLEWLKEVERLASRWFPLPPGNCLSERGREDFCGYLVTVHGITGLTLHQGLEAAVLVVPGNVPGPDPRLRSGKVAPEIAAEANQKTTQNRWDLGPACARAETLP